MTNQLRIAVIGTGLQAERRLSSMVGRKDVRVVCIAGRREEPTKALAELFGSQPVLGWEKVIKRDDGDAVVICTPPHTFGDCCNGDGSGEACSLREAASDYPKGRRDDGLCC